MTLNNDRTTDQIILDEIVFIKDEITDIHVEIRDLRRDVTSNRKESQVGRDDLSDRMDITEAAHGDG